MHTNDTIDQLGRRLENMFGDRPRPPANGGEASDGENFDHIWTSISLYASDVPKFREIMDRLLKHAEEFQDLEISHAISVHSKGKIVDAWTWAPELPN